MTDYNLTFNENGQPVVNGEVFPQTSTSGGTPWYQNDKFPFIFTIGNSPSGQEIVIQPSHGTNKINFNIDAAGLRHLQQNKALIDGSNDNVNFRLDSEATAGVGYKDMSISPSGKSIVVGGAYFHKVTFDSPGHSSTFRSEDFSGPDATARLQASFSRNVDTHSQTGLGGANDIPFSAPPLSIQRHYYKVTIPLSFQELENGSSPYPAFVSTKL